MLPTLLTFAQCEPALSWPGAILAIRRGHERPRPQQEDLILNARDGLLMSRAAHIEGLGFVIKAESLFPGNTAKGMPSSHGVVMLYDPDNGTVRAIIESKLVTQFKTVADSVLGAQCLARPDSRELVIVGAGLVASTLIRAYDTMFPHLERITVWSRRPEQAEVLAAQTASTKARLVATNDLRSAVQRADIIASATMSTSPLILGEWVKPGSHVDLIGAFTPEMREADDSLIAAASLYVDCRETVVKQIGEITQPVQSGAITEDHVRGDLYDLIAAGDSSRKSEEEVTVFKNGGGAHLDLMIADYIASTMATRDAAN